MAFDQTSAALAAPTSDPAGPHVATSCFDFLLIELVPMTYRLANEIATREQTALSRKSQLTGSKVQTQKQALASRRHSGTTASTGVKGGTVVAAVQNGKSGAAGAASGLGIGGIGGAVGGLDEDETREMILWRLDNMGYRVGLGIVDKFARDKPRFTDTLDVIKFLCKDLWLLVFKKQIDNLKTNHRVGDIPRIGLDTDI
jgi:trafficking protein particle complex subunit 6